MSDSDDSDEEFNFFDSSEDEDEDNLEDPPEIEVKPATMPRKRSTSSVDNLASSMSRLSTGSKSAQKKKPAAPKHSDFSTGFSVPSVVYKYTKEDHLHAKVEFLVQPMKKEYFQPKVIRNGMALELRTEVPPMFFSTSRLEKACTARYDKNMHEHTSFDVLITRIKSEYEYEDENDKIFGPCQIVRLPFQCDEEIKNWEVQYHRHQDCPESFFENEGTEHAPQWTLVDHLYYAVLVVELVSVEKKKVKTRGAQRHIF